MEHSLDTDSPSENCKIGVFESAKLDFEVKATRDWYFSNVYHTHNDHHMCIIMIPSQLERLRMIPTVCGVSVPRSVGDIFPIKM